MVSTTHFRFPVQYGNFELFKLLTDMKMVSIIQLKLFRSLLHLVHLMSFKRRTRILEAGDTKKMLQTPCWKEKGRSAVCVGKIQHRKNCVLKGCMLTR